MATRSLEATIDFLLTCLECTEGKTDWEKVAVTTGWYKGGKFSRQAFTGIQKKYGGTVIGSADETNGNLGNKAKKLKTTPKKRGAGDGDVKNNGRKKAKKEETPEVKGEDEDGAQNGNYFEAEDSED